MATAYKCDVCQKYCDGVYTIHGVCTPHTHFKFTPSGSTDCCFACYEEIMQKIDGMRKPQPEPSADGAPKGEKL